MRPLHGDETKAFFEKLANYIGSENIPRLLNRSEGTYLFLLHKERVFYVSEKVAKYAGSCARENLLSFGVCFGKFTKTKKFRLQITALDYLAPYAQYKIWVKPSSEQSFLYGNHVLKERFLEINVNFFEKLQGSGTIRPDKWVPIRPLTLQFHLATHHRILVRK